MTLLSTCSVSCLPTPSRRPKTRFCVENRLAAKWFHQKTGGDNGSLFFSANIPVERKEKGCQPAVWTWGRLSASGSRDFPQPLSLHTLEVSWHGLVFFQHVSVVFPSSVFKQQSTVYIQIPLFTLSFASISSERSLSFYAVFWAIAWQMIGGRGSVWLHATSSAVLIDPGWSWFLLSLANSWCEVWKQESVFQVNFDISKPLLMMPLVMRSSVFSHLPGYFTNIASRRQEVNDGKSKVSFWLNDDFCHSHVPKQVYDCLWCLTSLLSVGM